MACLCLGGKSRLSYLSEGEMTTEEELQAVGFWVVFITLKTNQKVPSHWDKFCESSIFSTAYFEK